MATSTTKPREEDALIASLEAQGLREFSWGDYAMKMLPLSDMSNEELDPPAPSH